MQGLRRATGYCVIVLPDQGIWQGFPLFRLGSTPSYVAGVREVLNEGPCDENNLITNPPAHVPLENVPSLGALQAVTVTALMDSDLESLITAASGVAHLLEHNFFWIEGVVRPEGICTRLGQIEATSIEEAEEAAPFLPVVMNVVQPSLQ